MRKCKGIIGEKACSKYGEAEVLEEKNDSLNMHKKVKEFFRIIKRYHLRGELFKAIKRKATVPDGNFNYTENILENCFTSTFTPIPISCCSFSKKSQNFFRIAFPPRNTDDDLVLNSSTLIPHRIPLQISLPLLLILFLMICLKSDSDSSTLPNVFKKLIQINILVCNISNCNKIPWA